MVFVVLYCPNISIWFAELDHLRFFLCFSGVVSLLLVFKTFKKTREKKGIIIHKATFYLFIKKDII